VEFKKDVQLKQIEVSSLSSSMTSTDTEQTITAELSGVAPDVVAIGEVLVDFTPVDQGMPADQPFRVPLLAANPGGAPANVCAALAKLGIRAAFIGKVGDDPFGHQLVSTLETVGVDTSGMVFTSAVQTTLAFVHLGEGGERSFHFYRNPGADTTLSLEEVDLERIRQARVFHFGSVSLTHNPSRLTTLSAARHAAEAGCLVSFDPNLRPFLWPDLDQAREQIETGLELATLVKLSEEELAFIDGDLTRPEERGLRHDLTTVARRMAERYQIRALFVTLGAQGCYAHVSGPHGFVGHVPGFPVPAVDTTGAGDAFMAGVLSQLARFDYQLSAVREEQWLDIVRFANAMGGLTTTKRGAIPALPNRAEVERLLAG
jgi:sugar/nucleoside kinase (ribokinase family)